MVKAGTWCKEKKNNTKQKNTKSISVNWYFPSKTGSLLSGKSMSMDNQNYIGD